MTLLASILSVFLTADGEATPIAELPQALCGEVLPHTKFDATCAPVEDSPVIETSIRPKKNPFYEN